MLTFNVLLHEAGLDPKSVRLFRHQEDLRRRGEEWKTRPTPYHLWTSDPEEFAHFQRWQNRSRRIDQGQTLASFVVTPEKDNLFVGCWRSDGWEFVTADEYGNYYPKGHPEVVRHDFVRTSELEQYIGRLSIEWGTGTRAALQHAARNEKPIAEIRKQFREPKFPGYARFLCRIGDLPALPAAWQQVLAASQGVYLLTSPKGEQYVGAAVGADGLWGRIAGYANSDQGNVGLKGKPLADFTVTILDTVPTSAKPKDVLELELLWKSKLGSRAHGLNPDPAARIFGLNWN
ncbi:MAG: GIY-YIG nuclease family protein [Rhodobiaceae bacterium]|nr:GIY-YIG nuclease family protein [Rhodobiaceae bacterium]